MSDLRDWAREAQEVEKIGSTDWFKPQPDVSHTVTFQDEGGEPYQQTFEDRTVTRVDFRVSVEGGEYAGEELTWSLSRGGPQSLYGMLVKVFRAAGKATNQVVHVRASGQGLKRRYVVKEFNDLQFQPVGEVNPPGTKLDPGANGRLDEV